MPLEKLEMHDIQDKTRLLDEMNETREGVNLALASVDKLSGDDKGLNRIVKGLEERITLLESRVENPMKAPKPKPKAKAKNKAKSNTKSDHGFQKA